VVWLYTYVNVVLHIRSMKSMRGKLRLKTGSVGPLCDIASPSASIVLDHKVNFNFILMVYTNLIICITHTYL